MFTDHKSDIRYDFIPKWNHTGKMYVHKLKVTSMLLGFNLLPLLLLLFVILSDKTQLPLPVAPVHVDLLKPTGYVMHQQFNIQQMYALPTLYLCVLYLSENKQRLVPLTAQTDWFL